MKVSRHAKIVELIMQYDIETQEELAEGICSLQALSRIETGVSGVRHDYKGDA